MTTMFVVEGTGKTGGGGGETISDESSFVDLDYGNAFLSIHKFVIFLRVKIFLSAEIYGNAPFAGQITYLYLARTGTKHT